MHFAVQFFVRTTRQSTMHSLMLLGAMLCLCGCQKEETPTREGGTRVFTLAGNGISGFQNYSGVSATFNFPVGLTVDPTGNIFVADAYNNAIRKVTPDGQTTTLANTSGAPGFQDGNQTTARFNSPYGLTLDAAGNLYVIDYGNHSIRKVTPSGQITTLAGNGTPGFQDGTGTTARFSFPVGIASDATGNLYVADYSNHSIRKVTPGGQVTTLAGNGTSGFQDGAGTAARFSFPLALCVDANGNVIVTEEGNYRIRKITPDGQVSTLAGDGTPGFKDGAAAVAQFKAPRSISPDAAGNLFVAERDGQRIRKLTPDGQVTTVAGDGTQGLKDGLASVAKFRNPRGVVVDVSGNLYVADADNHSIRRIEFR
jgi:sugar lactone lactonase YvrE